MSKNNISVKKKIIPNTLILGNENVIQGDKKMEKIYFSDIKQNGKKGVYTNIISCTPEDQPTLVSFGNNKYLNIELNEMFEKFLICLKERIDPEYSDLVNEKYLLDCILENYKEKGFVKCKIDLEKFNSSFFSTVEKEKDGKIKVRHIKNDVDFRFDKITKGSYTLKVTGFWRKETQVEGKQQITNSGLTIKVLNVLVNDYTSSKVDQDDEYEEFIFNLLKEDSIKLLTE